MKMKKTLLLLGISILFAVPAISQIFSSGFETWTTTAPIKPTDWVGTKTSFAADSIHKDSVNFHGGLYGCRLQSRTTSHKRLTTLPLTVTSGTTYTVSYWVRGHGSIRAGLFNGGTNYTTAYSYCSYIAVNSATWAQETQTVSSDTNSTTAEFIISVKSSFADLQDIQIDDVTITASATPAVTIHDIQYSTTPPYVSPRNGQAIITSGVVSAIYNKGFFMQDAYGPWNGIYVFDSAHAATAGVVRGDSITLSGTVSEYQTYTEIGSLTGLTKISAGTIHPAYPVTKANSTTEELEGVLVTLTNIPCVDASGSPTYGEWTVYNGTDSTKIGGLLYKYTTAVAGTSYNITGVVYLAYGGVVRVEPRDANDVTVATGISEIDKNSISIFPNPVSSTLFLNNIEGTQMIRISNILGETIQSAKVLGNFTTINVSKLSDGVYFISLIDANGVINTKKFIKD